MIAGVIGIIAINIVEFFMRMLKISQTTLWEAGGSVFLSENTLKTPLGIIIGIISHVFVGLLVGVIISYYLCASGKKLAIWKGIIISMFFLFFILGILFPFRHLAPEMQNHPGDVLSAFIDHIVFGGMVGYMVAVFQKRQTKG